MLPSYTLMQSCKTGKKCSLFYFFFIFFKKSALYPFVDKGRRKRPWINGDSSDVSVAHFLSPSVWNASMALARRRSLLVFSRGWNAEGFWICRGLLKLPFFPARIFKRFHSNHIFLTFLNFRSCFHASSFFYLSLLVCLKNICPAQTCSPFSCFYGLGCCLFPWIWQKWHKHTRK